MKSRLKVLFFVAMILKLSTEISGARENDIAKANVKQAVMEKIGRGEKVNQGHINELADIETAKLEGKLFEELLSVGYPAEEATYKMKLWGLAPYGRVYNEARLHGSHDLEPHEKAIRDKIEKKQQDGEDISQQHFDELAARETEKLRHQEYANLLADGYPPGLARRLIYERGLMDEGEVYDKLRKPHINLRTGSSVPMDLTIARRNIIQRVKYKKEKGIKITPKVLHDIILPEWSRLRGSLYDTMRNVGLDHNIALDLVNDRGFRVMNEVFDELRKPAYLMEETFSKKRKEKQQPGEGSSSGSGHQSAVKRLASNN